MGVKLGSNEGNSFISGKCLDNHGGGMQPLESQVSPSDGCSVIVGEPLPTDF